MLVLPALASAAQTYVVGATGNVAPDVGCASLDPAECDLGEAITLANEDAEADTIEFAVEHVQFESELPAITQPLTIDGGSGPGGGPGVELDGETEGFIPNGLRVEADEVAIRGLAITRYGAGIFLLAEKASICENHLGVELGTGLAAPNSVGIRVGGAAADNGIGSGCAAGNVISGNDWVGILDEGVGTRIRRNLIGADPAGDPLPNGEFPAPSEPSGGIIASGTGTQIGGTAAGQGNTIAFNENSPLGGGGVIVEDPGVSIRGNSTFANFERGIFFRFGVSPPIPRPIAATSVETVSTVITGDIEGAPSTAYEVDVFANAGCDLVESGPGEFDEEGEGETYLGTALTQTDGVGVGQFEATVPPQAEGTVITATATGVASGSTSAFSGCIVAPKPAPKPDSPPSTPATQSTAGPPAPPPPPAPENGESVVVAPASGKVFIRLPGAKNPRLLVEGQEIPVGSIIDATRGKVTLTSVNRAGEIQTAVFYGGRFLVAQQEGSGLVVLKLRSDLSACGGKATGSATASGKKGGKLWGSGKGKYRTEGNHGSATVRGTVWLTEDRCGGTFFKVRKGVVTVRDFAGGETFPLGPGKTYLATP